MRRERLENAPVLSEVNNLDRQQMMLGKMRLAGRMYRDNERSVARVVERTRPG